MRKRVILLSPYCGRLGHYCRFQSNLQSCCWHLSFPRIKTCLNHCGCHFHSLWACCCSHPITHCYHIPFHFYRLSCPCTFGLFFCHRSLHRIYSRRSDLGQQHRLCCRKKTHHGQLWYLFCGRLKNLFARCYEKSSIGQGGNRLQNYYCGGHGCYQSFLNHLTKKTFAGCLHQISKIYFHCHHDLTLRNRNDCRLLLSYLQFKSYFGLSDLERCQRTFDDSKLATMKMSGGHLMINLDHLVRKNTILKGVLKVSVSLNAHHQFLKSIYSIGNYFASFGDVNLQLHQICLQSSLVADQMKVQMRNQKI